MKRTALEVLFARAEQGRFFLMLLPCGLLLGLLVTLGGRLQRRSRVLGMAVDASAALLAGAAAWGAAFLSGDGLRLYALLGLLLGAALWCSGLQPLLDALWRVVRRCGRSGREKEAGNG
ncbi:MAG: hypothetical protein IKK57_00395 [Clostridia bacterium]|nr:hypothetical protein [Clostridia bacterium]